MSDTAITAVQNELAKANVALADAKVEWEHARRRLSETQQAKAIWENEVDQLQKALAVLKGEGR